MAWFQRKSRWQRLTKPVADRVPGTAAVRSGAVAAGAAVAVTVASSAISALRKKPRS